MGGFLPAAPAIQNAFLTTPAGWRGGWDTALHGAASAEARLALMGASLGCYVVSPADVLADRTMTKVRANFTSTPGIMRDYFPVSDSASGFGAWGAGTPPWVMSSSGAIKCNTNSLNDPATIMSIGFHTYWRYAPAPASPIATFTMPSAGTRLDLVYYVTASGTWTYKLDGGGAVTVTDAGGDVGKLKVLSLTGLSNTAHTWVFDTQSADNQIYLMGAMPTYNTHGLSVFNWASPGQDLTSLIASTNTTLSTDLVTLGIDPHLAIIDLLVVEALNTGGSPDRMAASLTSLLHALRKARPTMSIAIVGANIPDNVYSEGVGTISGLVYAVDRSSWDAYLDRAQAIATLYNCAFLCLQGSMGQQTVTSGYRNNSDIHFLAAGHTYQAAQIMTLLNGPG